MNCTQKQQLVSFPKVRIWKPWFRYFNNHKEFRNEGTVHLFSLMALFSYANFRSNERVINGERYMEAPGQWICKLGSLPRILRVHSKRQALEQLDYYEKYGFLTYEWLDKVGYIYISIDSCRGTVGDMDCLVIDSPEELLDKLLYEMAVDIMEEGGHDLNPVEASALERAEVARRLNVYLEQLPEYQDRISFVFERK